MQETESIDEYILQHIDPESDYLKALYRDCLLYTSDAADEL
mgnify:FL=1